MKRIQLLLLTLLALCAGFVGQAGAQAAPAAQRQRCFNETGFCVSGPILDYWEQKGGLAVFGYPISPLRNETIEGSWTGPTQWFERDRLEDHSNEGKGVLAGRLGARFLELRGTPWKPGNDGPRPGYALCTKFDQTGYNVCAPFSYYWQNNGGLERFGYPITPAFEETIEGRTYLVQYFERRRMEYHPENAGTPYDILLGLLGRDVFPQCFELRDGPLQLAINRYKPTLGCPSENARDTLPAAVQQFEHGWMIWLGPTSSAPPMIFVLYTTPSGMRYRWLAFTDTYREGEQVGGGENPPAGKIAPARGFGKIWWTNQTVRDALGWAVAPEQGETGSGVFWNDGHWMVHLIGANRLFVMQNGGFASVE